LNKEFVFVEGYIRQCKKEQCTGVDPGFQVRGGALKKIAPSGGRRENVLGISCKKNHDITPKNHIFSNCGGRREHFWGISCEKSDFTPKNLIFSKFSSPPTLDPPLV
jgi:hypothetical protein